ncbi:MAG: hypothetical protein IPP35_08100 [Elusimicrobia bacterium]|nr:hypothetical protein [Elusimicrobiota bacterium]
MEQSVQDNREESNRITSQASKAAQDVEQSVGAANALMNNLENQTDTSFPSRFEPKSSVKALEQASKSVKESEAAVQTALNARDYGKAQDIQTTLESKQGDLTQKTEEVTQAGESFKKFQQSLRGLTVAMKDLSPKADLKQTGVPVDPLSEEFLKRAHMSQAKQNIDTHRDAGLTALEEMAAQGLMSAEEAQAFASTLSNAATRLTVAAPRTMVNDLAAMAHEVLTYPISSTRRDLARSADGAIFTPLGSLSETNPALTQVIGTVGYHGSKSALLGCQLVGIAFAGYFALTAPLVTGGIVISQWAVQTGLKGLGVPEESAEVGGFVGSFIAGMRINASPKVNSTDDVINSKLISGAKDLWAQGRNLFLPPIRKGLDRWNLNLGESGHILVPERIGSTQGFRHLPVPSSPRALSSAFRSKNELSSVIKFKSISDANVGWRAYKTAYESKDIITIGNITDTAVAEAFPGHRVLNLRKGWTPEVNDAWIQGGIDRRARFYLASPQTSVTLTNSFGESMFARELRRLRVAGYRQNGDYLVPSR